MNSSAALPVKPEETWEALLRSRLIAIVRTTDEAETLPLAHALAEGGIRVLEVSLTTPGALEAIRRIAYELPAVRIGAGTVLRAAQAEAAIQAGSQFLVSPGFSPGVLEVANGLGTPYMPGALTPSEVMVILDRGLRFIKIFPAGALGPAYIKELLGPFPELKPIPTGGVTEQNARGFLEAGAQAVGMGGVLTRMTGPGQYDQVTARAASLMASLSAS